jgi:formamidopyrimidine-DNA glycosylase
MPELPEVETIRRDLDPRLRGHAVVRLDIQDRRLMSLQEENRFRKNITASEWTDLSRKGKYLVARLANDFEIIFHLRMTGQLVLQTPNGVERAGILEKPLGTGYRMRLEFDHGVCLDFYDQRRFGEVFLKGPKDPWPGKTELGPDPLNGLSQEDFIGMVKEKTTRIKPLLMDQSFIAGVGNIYAQEALFRAFIRPSRPGNKITRNEAGALYKALRETLLSAIEHRGSTSRNYRDAFGESGSAQKLHAVYRRGNQPCLKCRSPLRESRVGGRGTVFCPSCQH